MKKIYFLISFLITCFSSQAQWNTVTDGIQYNGGNVGIGSQPGSNSLRIVSSGVNDGEFLFKGIGEEAFFRMSNGNNWGMMIRSDMNSPKIGAWNGGALTIHPFSSFNWDLDISKGALATFNFASMMVGIGTASPDNKLHVEGDFLLDTYNNSGHEKGIYFREGFSTTNKYNLSILTYDHNGGGSSPDGLSINAYDGISFSTGSNARSEKMRVASSGNVGIGTSTPGSKLDINITAHDDGIYLKDNGSPIFRVTKELDGGRLNMYDGGIGEVQISTRDDHNTFFNHGGNVGIGTSTPQEKLDVNGTIRSKKVKVEAIGWPDYVFAPSFQLRSLSEVESYIRENQHLPEVPSAKEIETKGLDLGAMDATLLKKVEELTLYTIDQEKRIKKQDQLISDLLKRLEKLEKKD